MGTEVSSKGRLLTLEGGCGHELKQTAARLLQALCGGEDGGGASYWNASGIFSDLRLGDPNIPRPSPRTLVLLYSADLAFRLRWEIRPALDEGKCVIAVPYVQTAMAFGKAAGLPRPWLRELFRLAPLPQACYRIPEMALAGAPDGKPSDSYFEFCCAALQNASQPCDPVELHGRFRAYLDALERRRRCETVTPQFLSASTSHG